MAKITKAQNDKALREAVFSMLFEAGTLSDMFQKINDRQYGILMTDLNGVTRYVRIGAIVAEERDDMTAEDLMRQEIADYEQKQADKAEKAANRKKKAEKDKAKREAEAKAKEDDPQE
jgi:hypothetical protein